MTDLLIICSVSRNVHYPFLVMFFISQIFSSDCTLVESLAIGLNMHITNPILMIKLRLNCCSAFNVICEGSDVVKITWNSLNLNGTINETAIPHNIQLLDLTSNAISGLIPKIDQLMDLTIFKVVSNALNGSFSAFPPFAMDVRIGDNAITGSIPAFPESLNIFTADNCLLSGTIPDNMPYNLQLRNNFLTGNIPRLPLDMKILRVPLNLLSGGIPFIPSSLVILTLGSMQKFNKINGSLYLDAPTELIIFNNLITGIFINDTSKLEVCDLRYNPISLSLLVNFTMCQRGNTGANYTPYDYKLNNITIEATSINSIVSTATEVTTVTITSTQEVLTTSLPSSKIVYSTKSTVRSQLLHFSTKKQSRSNLSSTAMLSATTAVSTTTNNDRIELRFNFDPFDVLKLVVDTLVLLYLLRKLFKRSRPKNSTLHSYQSSK